TIAFSGAISAASATNPANYQVTCGGANVPVTRVRISEDARIVTVFVSPPLAGGGGCSLVVHDLQGPGGVPIAGTNLVLNCAAEPCGKGSSGTEYWLTFPGNYAPNPTNQPVVQL